MLRALLLATSLVWLGTAHAQPSRKTGLSWVRAPGAESCIDPRSLAARVEALTGPVLVPLARSEVAIEAAIAPVPSGGFRMRFTVTDHHGMVQGERVHEQPVADCRQLDDAVAFILAVTIDPELALPDDVAAVFAQETPPEEMLLGDLEQTPPQPSAPPAAPSPAPAPLPEPAPPMPEALHTELALLATVVWGAAPDLMPGLVLAAQRSFGRMLWAFVSLRLLPPLREADLADTHRLRIQSYALALGPCAALHFGVVDVRGCVGAQAGLLSARGTGFDIGETAVGVQVAAVGSGQLQISLSRRWRVRAEGAAELNLSRPRFSYSSFQGLEKAAFSAPLLGATISFGALLAF